MSDTAFAMVVLIFLVIVLIFYVLYALSHMKALKALGYNKAWLVWIAPIGLYWALAEVAMDLDGTYDMEVLSFRIPGTVFKLWYLIAVAVSFIPAVGGILNLVLTIICAGTCYIKMYAKLDNKEERDVQALGYVSAFFPVIAVFKFLTGKYSAS